MLQVSAFDSNIVQVGKADRSKDDQIKYNIKLLDYHWKLDELEDPMSVLVTSKLTEQAAKVIKHRRQYILVSLNTFALQVHVQTSGKKKPPCGGFFFYYRHTLTVIISMLVIFFVTFYGMILYSYLV